MIEPIRGVWITDVDSAILDSRSQIATGMKLLAETGFNYVFPVVWNGGFTQYRSQLMQKTFGVEIDPKSTYKNRDPLEEIILEATKYNLKIIPWFEYGFACSYQENGGHILAKKPHWAAKDRGNKLLKKNGFEWMNAFDPEVREFILSLIVEVISNYNVAGIQGDDRLPALPSEGGYDDLTQTLYRQKFACQAPQNHQERSWLQWRADILSDFLAQIKEKVKSINPELIISLAPSPHPFGYKEYLQDPKNWLKRGLVDIIHPQLYRRNFWGYKGALKETLYQLGEDKAKIFPGMLIRIGNYHCDGDTLWQSITYNRQHNVLGEILFFYEELRANDCALAKFLQQKNYGSS